MTAQHPACPCMERIAEETRAWKETAANGEVSPMSQSSLTACSLACWKDAALLPDDLTALAQVEGLCRWATAGDQKSLKLVRTLFHPLSDSSPFSFNGNGKDSISSAASASSSLEQAASATTGAERYLQDLASASSCPHLTPNMINAGGMVLVEKLDANPGAETVVGIYEAMYRARFLEQI